MDAIPLGEHVEVKSLDVTAVAHFSFPVFVWTLLGFRWRSVHRDIALRSVGKGAADGSLRPDRGETKLIVYKFKSTSESKTAINFRHHKVPLLPPYPDHRL